MEGEPRQRNQSQKTKRRDRAARMLKQKQAAQSRNQGDVSGEEGDDSPVREKRPPSRKKKNKEPIYQEDIVDGFAFLCFKTYEDLETVNKAACESKAHNTSKYKLNHERQTKFLRISSTSLLLLLSLE